MGDIVEYDWKKAEKFRNITRIEQINVYLQGSGEKDKQIVRTSCLKSAAMILGSLDTKLNKKAGFTIAVARHFEKYIEDALSDIPSTNSLNRKKPYKEADNYLDL